MEDRREVTGEVTRLLMVCDDELTRRELQGRLKLKGEENFRNLILMPALDAGRMEMTIPEKPRSRLQKYQLTTEGKALRRKLQDRGSTP